MSTAHAIQKFDHEDPKNKGSYAVVRQAAGLSLKQAPDAMIEAVWTIAGGQAKNVYELAVFLSVANRHGLDPLAKEIFLFQTGKGPAVWAGRDGFMKAAQRQANYMGHALGVVYKGEPFKIIVDGNDVRVMHEMTAFPPLFEKAKPETHPIGGYCIAFGKDRRPTVIRRLFNDYRYLWTNDKKENWLRDAIGMFENRLLRAGLVRIIALGDLNIDGDDWESRQEFLERSVGQSTNQRLQDMRTKLEGVGERGDGGEEPAEEAEAEIVLSEEEMAAARLKSYQEAFEAARKKAGLPANAVRAWAKQTASLPEDVREWTVDNLIFAMQAVAESDGRDLWVEYGRWLANKAGLHGGELIEVESDLLNAPDLSELLQLIKRLDERVPSQARSWP